MATAATGVERKRERERGYHRTARRADQDILAKLWPIEDLPRREAALTDLKCFYETYFGPAFYLPWSRDQLRAIEIMETVVKVGGLFAFAEPRGNGKTTRCRIAALWAILGGYRRWPFIVGSTEGAAQGILRSTKTDITYNERLKADFPLSVGALSLLDNEPRAAAQQRFDGELSNCEWKIDRIVFPTIADHPEFGPNQASGARLTVGGITGNVRGQQESAPDGEVLRPDLLLNDDPQTKESAHSISQTRRRMEILSGDLLGLAGPTTRIAAFMPLTVIQPGDLADQALDRQKHPEWQGVRTRMLNSFPTDEKLWDEYAELRADGLRAGDSGAAATAFYAKHRAKMDVGAEASWAERFNEDELSAIQHAINLKLTDNAAFFAEYQNDPLPEYDPAGIELPTADELADRINGYARGLVPLGRSVLTAFIDPHQPFLWWAVCGWGDGFTGDAISYGTEPDQGRPYFTKRDQLKTLAMEMPTAGFEGALYGGLERLCEAILGHHWERDDGAEMRVERCLIDANWGEYTDVVYQFCRESKHSAVLMPSHGKYYGASTLRINDPSRAKKRGERRGLNWFIPPVSGRRVRHVVYDTNWWKTFLFRRLAVAEGDRGGLRFFGKKGGKFRHRMLADHLLAEKPIDTEGRGRKLVEWKLPPSKPDNEGLDALVGCAVAASMQGIELPESKSPAVKTERPPPLVLSAIQQRR